MLLQRTLSFQLRSSFFFMTLEKFPHSDQVILIINSATAAAQVITAQKYKKLYQVLSERLRESDKHTEMSMQSTVTHTQTHA